MVYYNYGGEKIGWAKSGESQLGQLVGLVQLQHLPSVLSSCKCSVANPLDLALCFILDTFRSDTYNQHLRHCC